LSPEEYEAAALAYLNNNINQYASEIVLKLTKEGATSTCNNIIKMFPEIITYDLTFVFTKAMSLGLSGTSNKAYFFPFGSSTSYIDKDAMLVSTQGDFSGTYRTYLVKFSLKNAVFTPTSVGSLDGYSILSYGIDQYNGYYRIASFSLTPFEAQVTVFKEQNSQLKVEGRVTVEAGGVNSVRFFNEKGFLVTTEWSGVYYNETTTTMSLLNLTSPTNPSIAATEIITHPLYNMYPIEDGKYIISIGDSVSKANASGITVYLFQATNNSIRQVGKPSEIILTEQFAWVFSDAMYDAHAFRYLSQSRKLIIPVSVYVGSYYNGTTDVNEDDNFQGFFVYDVDLAKGVKYVGNVTHDVASYCYSYPPRSMVFNGDLITVMGSTIKRTSSITTLSNLKWELESYCAFS
jgi:DNA excision repair protein ERCC-4